MTASAMQYPLDLSLPPVFAHANFFVSECNRDAFSWVMNWPHWRSYGLILSGPRACGKTHLAQLWQQKSGAVGLRAEQLGSAPTERLLQHVRTVLLEDFQPEQWPENLRQSREEGLLFLLQHLSQQNGSLLMTSTLQASQWQIALPDVRSRLQAFAAISIEMPDDALLAALLAKLFADRQLQLSADRIAYVAARMERSFTAARQLVERLDRQSLAEKRPITLSMIKELIDK